MRRDADIQVQRISRAIDTVLRSDGWINGIKDFYGRHLKKIAEAMARKCAEPSQFTNQGFHNTSITQCILRQELETNPAQVMEMIASVVATGKAPVGQGKHNRVVTLDQKSLALDLESRWTNDDSSSDNGLRDAVGQFFDLLVTQAFWDARSSHDMRYVYTQDPKSRPGTTGERLFKVDVKSGNRIEVTHEGPNLTVADTFDIVKFFDETPNAVIAHSSVVGDLKEPSITDATELGHAITTYNKTSGKPPILIVFAGLLPGGGGESKGYDLHAVTALAIEDTYFLESRWGLKMDMNLNGLTADQLLNAMIAPEASNEEPEDFHDNAIVFMRTVDPSYPIPKYARAPQMLAMQKESEQIFEIEKRALSSPSIQAQEKYFEELEKWEARRKEHRAVFGDDLPFKEPAPSPPSTQHT